MTDNLDALALRDDLLEIAERYETVAALDLTAQPATEGSRAKPGSRVPPGMQVVLDADEIGRVLTAVDDWVEFLAHVIAEECDVAMPDLTPARLRTVAEHAAHLAGHEDEMLTLSVEDDAHEHRTALRRLAGRGVRRIRTGHRCQVGTCGGYLVSSLGERTDAALVCDKDPGHQVPHSVWSHWPHARVQYVTVEHAARMLGTTVAAAKMRASRGKWRRVGTGADVRYSVEDVREASGMVAS